MRTTSTRTVGSSGRTIVVDSGDDLFQGATNKQLTQSAITNDFALVGGFSLEDSFGGALLAQSPGMPDVTVTLDPSTNKLSNVYSPAPASGGWQEGPLQYFKQKYPKGITSVASLVADEPSAQTDWAGEKYVMQKVGYKVVYDETYSITQTDFTQNVIAMKNLGVKMLFIDQMPENYAAAVLKALQQQNFHPMVILGAATYSNDLVSASGGAAAVNGDYLQQNASLYLGQDAVGDPGGQHLPALGERRRRPGSSRTCSRSTAGCRRSCSPRRSRTRVRTRAGDRSSRRSTRSPPSTGTTSRSRPIRWRRR